MVRLGEAFDMVIAMHPEGQGEGEFLRHEQGVRAAASGYAFDQGEALPLALYPSACLFQRRAIQELYRAGRPWRLAFVSRSLGAVEAVAAQGLAETVVNSGTFPPRLRRREGMPSLLRADLRLHRAPRLSRAAGLLAEHLVGAPQSLPWSEQVRTSEL